MSPNEDVVLLTSCWKVSPIKDRALFTSCWEVSPIEDVDEIWFGFDGVGGSGAFDVGGGGFDDLGGGGGFDKWPDCLLVSIALLSRGNMPHFLKPIFISATVIDS